MQIKQRGPSISTKGSAAAKKFPSEDHIHELTNFSVGQTVRGTRDIFPQRQFDT